MEKEENSTTKASTSERDWTKGNITRNLLTLSWPIIISDTLNLIGPTIDMIWVGKLGAASIAGVGVAGLILMVASLGMWGINTGLRAMVARFVGAGDIKGAIHVCQQAFVVCSSYSIAIAAIGITFAEPLLVLLGVGPDVVSEGTIYLRIAFIGMVAVSFHIVAESIMQASGDTMTPMKISIIIRIIHVILDPFLIFGLWIFPYMGVRGAAVANILSVSIGMIIAFWIVFTGRSRLRITLKNFRLDFSIIWRMVKIGLPASVMGAQQSLGRIVLLGFIAPFGTLAVAGFSILERIGMFVWMPASGFGRGVSVLVGQNLGAQQPERAEKSAWLAAGLVGIIVFIFSAAMLLWPESVIRIFSPDPELIEITSVFLMIIAISYLPLGLNAVLEWSLAGAGDTLPPLIIESVRTWVVTLPLAYILLKVTNLGVYGVWWSIVIGIMASASAYVIYFRLGIWKKKKV